MLDHFLYFWNLLWNGEGADRAVALVLVIYWSLLTLFLYLPLALYGLIIVARLLVLCGDLGHWCYRTFCEAISRPPRPTPKK